MMCRGRLARSMGAWLASLALAAGARAGEPPVERLPPPAGQAAGQPVNGTIDAAQPIKNGSDPLDRPLESLPPVTQPAAAPADFVVPVTTPFDPPTGYAGPSGVLPEETRDNDFIPVPDRWRVGFPDWDRYDKGHPWTDEYPFLPGSLFNPYTQNVLKGDYPVIGQNTFLNLSVSSITVFDERQVPTATTPFETTSNPYQEQFFGKPGQFFWTTYLRLSAELFHGDAEFKPADWRIKVTPVFDLNDLNANELAVVNSDVRKGTQRLRSYLALEEWFAEAKLADLSPNYDFLSIRAGSQFFDNDFRGFLFDDTNRAVRLFGTLNSNRDQFNLVYFDMLEKDTNSELNTYHSRDQHLLFGNWYHQDFIWPGYTIQGSVVYNHDNPTFHYNRNGFLTRPDPVGVFQPHGLDIAYLGLASDGHINRFNVTSQFYWALGHDSLNPLANKPQDVNAQFTALELSYDRDYVRFRTSFLWSSGDDNINNCHATGFDTIMDNPNFAGGQFSYWQRQAIQLFGVNLVNARSIVPDLRASKIEGQSNFVNPGLFLYNVGMDVDITPKIKMINNCNLLWFDEVDVLKQYVFQASIHKFIGVDLSTGFEYRPLLNNNIIATAGVSTLIPGHGFDDLYSNVNSPPNPLVACFLQLNLNF